MKHYILSLAAGVAAMLSLTACHDIHEEPNNPRGNFESLWKQVDQHYCFLDEKGLDWDEVYTRYSSKIDDRMSSQQLFGVLSDMLDELRDGHVNLSAPFATSYYKKWWSDYPQNFNLRNIQEQYLHFNYRQLGAFTYGMLPDNVGYVYYSTFTSGLGDGNIDYILAYFAGANALIFDVRDNGGGNMDNVKDLVCRFITRRILAGYIRHKTGPGHDQFSEPYAYYIDPIGGGHFTWTKPVVVLANRSTFSAANNFVSIMKLLPGVTVVGATTGGGSGMPYSTMLPNGWGLRFSACPVYDAQRHLTESGVEPTEGCAVDMTPEEIAQGKDAIIDFAVNYINTTLLNGSSDSGR